MSQAVTYKREPEGQLREEQLIDLAFYIQQDKAANLSDPGTGKTPPTCVEIFRAWHELGYRTIWAMPKSLLEKNYKELLKFTPFDPEDLVIYDGTPEQRNKILETRDPKVFLMGFVRLAEEWPLLLQEFPDIKVLAVDEIHLGFGGHSSWRTGQFYEVVKRVKKFIPMTGTLINGKLDKTYPTIHAIEPRYYGSYENFIYQHAIKDENGKIIGWKNHKKLAAILAAHSIRRTFEQTYGKNVIVNQTEWTRMTSRQKEAYEEFSAKAMMELESGQIMEAANGGVYVLRCRQIMSHPECVKLPTEYDKNGKPIAWKEYNLTGKEMTGKDELLSIHLEDHRNAGTPFIIFAAFKPEVERINRLCQKMGFKGGYMHGGVSMNDRNRLNRFMEAKEIDYVVATPDVAGVGFNWGHVDHVLFPSVGYTPSQIRQPRDRAQRGKRTRPLRVSFFGYEDSPVEKRVFEIVERKSDDEYRVDPSYDRIYITRRDPNAAHS